MRQSAAFCSALLPLLLNTVPQAPLNAHHVIHMKTVNLASSTHICWVSSGHMEVRRCPGTSAARFLQ